MTRPLSPSEIEAIAQRTAEVLVPMLTVKIAPDPDEGVLWGARQVEAYLGCSARTLSYWQEKPEFPRVMQGHGHRKWLATDIKAYRRRYLNDAATSAADK